MSELSAPNAPTGLTAPGAPIVPSAALEDFLQHVAVQANGCWFWDGQPDSYGTYQGQPAHRASWELYQGPIPPGLDILHGCDWKGCVNPAHLRPGTPKENAADRGRAAVRIRSRQQQDEELERTIAEYKRWRECCHTLELEDEAQQVIEHFAAKLATTPDELVLGIFQRGWSVFASEMLRTEEGGHG